MVARWSVVVGRAEESVWMAEGGRTDDAMAGGGR